MILAAFGTVTAETVVAGEAVATDETGKVVGGELFLLAEPSATSTVIASYPTDTTVEIIAEVDDFYEVKMPDGNTGYVAAAYIVVYPVDGITTPEAGQVMGGELHLREEPSLESTVIASYPTGTDMTIIGEENGFYHVQMSDGNVGYMETAYVQVLSYDDAGTVYDVGKVVGGELHLRAEPSLDSEILGTYDTGTVVHITSEENDFYHVVTPDGLTGYMEADYIYLY